MKKSKLTKSNDPVKILRMISRNDQMERNGGGQFVAVNRIWKDKSKYDRKAFKKGLRSELNPFYFITFIFSYIINCQIQIQNFHLCCH